MTITWEYEGNSEKVEFEQDDIFIGRSAQDGEEGAQLVLDFDGKVSRKHARIWLEDDDYWLEDVGSTRGTSINGRKLEDDEVWGLTEKDVILIGETTLRVASLRQFRTMVLRPPIEDDDE